jgi:hypothetical protein
MTDTSGTINAKGLDATGFTEDLVAELFHRVGTHVMAIVDLQVVDKHGPSVKGKRKVTLIIDGIEPVVDNDDLEEHLRELTRTLHYNRGEKDAQLALDDSLEPKVADVMAAGAQHKAHPYIASGLAVDNGACDVCGLLEDATVHADRSEIPNPFLVDDDDQGDEPPTPDDDTFDPHPFAGGTDGEEIDGDHCVDCKQHQTAAVHQE